ncbi:MAG: hypothetical protein J6W52_02825 [Bacteroidaceae bacterium]|nr:hypothetical protein [Bacteroidaceae bacterium]
MALGITACAGMLTSCEYIQDGEKSMVLSGEWQGDFGMYYDYYDRGQRYTFDSYDTRITFIPAYSHAHHGTGTQVDYYAYGPYEYQYYRFHWSISGGVIYLTYEYDHELDTSIYNYHMTNDYLTGTFSSGTSFRLRKIIDFYDWTPYVNTYGYRDRHNWGYYPAPATRSDGELATDSVVTDSIAASESVEKGYVVSRGRRTTPLQQ